DIDLGRGEQALAHSLTGIPWSGVCVCETLAFQDSADQGEAVRVNATGGQAKQHVSSFHVALARQSLAIDHNTKRAACRIVIVLLVHAGHLSCLAADEGASSVDAACRNTFDKRGGGAQVELAAAIIIQEHQWSSALDNEIIDIHSNQVDAHGIVLAHLLRNHELGANAVDGANHDRELAVVQLKTALG
ncbi:hypothetical protein CH063_08140, partial [Colletotrichum higginsianum]